MLLNTENLILFHDFQYILGPFAGPWRPGGPPARGRQRRTVGEGRTARNTYAFSAAVEPHPNLPCEGKGSVRVGFELVLLLEGGALTLYELLDLLLADPDLLVGLDVGKD